MCRPASTIRGHLALPDQQQGMLGRWSGGADGQYPLQVQIGLGMMPLIAQHLGSSEQGVYIGRVQGQGALQVGKGTVGIATFHSVHRPIVPCARVVR